MFFNVNTHNHLKKMSFAVNCSPRPVVAVKPKMFVLFASFITVDLIKYIRKQLYQW